MAGDDWSVGGARIELAEGARVQVGLAPLSYRLQSSARLTAQLDGVVWSEYALSPFVELTLEELNGDVAALASTLRLQVPALQLAGSATVTGTLPGGPFAIEFDTEQLLSKPFLAGLFPDAGDVYDVDVGRVETRGALRVGSEEPPRIVGKLSLTLTDLRAHYEEVVIAGINGGLVARFDDSGWQVGPDRVEVALADVGFAITDLAAEVALTSPSLVVSELTGRTLGGDVTVDVLEYDIAEGDGRLLVKATALQLAEVLALEGDTITGSGTLDGHMPLQIDDNKIRGSDGHFRAREPGGVVRYGDAEEAATSFDQLGIGFAIAALADFRYEVLDIGVNYEPNGDLLLGVRLEGHNPSFEDGRPLHYNVNISENIPVLLRSLRLSDEFAKRLGRLFEQ
jgi:hypothetical protein